MTEHILTSAEMLSLKNTIGSMIESYLCNKMPYSKVVFHHVGFIFTDRVFGNQE